LRLIRAVGIEPEIIEYLQAPPSRLALAQLLNDAGIAVRDILRAKEKLFGELRLADTALSEDRLFDALEAHPILMQRPIVMSPLGVKVCRPPELVLELLRETPPAALIRDDGSDFLIDERVVGEPYFVAYRVRTLGGEEAGFASFQIQNTSAQLKGFTVLPSARGRGAGKNMMLLMLRRVYDLGAREMRVNAGEAEGFFQKMGFSPAGGVTASLVRPISLQVS
jgi:arsenate reductase